jgi:methylenetetrahydrofolate reductase (NADPH)
VKIIDILNKKDMSLSFEVFPPKRETAFESVKATAESIASSGPAFMSVTYGAGGGTSRYTLDICKDIEEKYNVPTLAHLTCVSSSHAMIKEKIEEIHAMGIENIMALRGDLTDELRATDPSTWDYRHAVELVREIKESGYDFCIGAACYPEMHPDSRDQREDIKYLKEKVDAGVDFLTTQMVFDNNLFFNFLYKIREAGITVPVLPGIMPITNANQVERAIKLSGSFMPQRFKAIVDYFGSDAEAMKQAGIAYATDQIIDLYANGITNVHVYSMNKPDVAQAIMNNLSNILWKDFGVKE